ncbi:MAG: oligosaccharide flippase family protein [Bacteroidales bacterium]|nr:oligosaccharide flippase family protein [Bacteroidales bacterium]
MTQKNVLIKNSTFGIIQFVAVAILTFLCVPIFIGKLGVDAYGVFALVSILGNLNFFSSFGLNSALLVFLSKQGKTEESQRDIVVVLFSTIVIALFLCSLLYIFKTSIIENIFGVPQEFVQSSSCLYDYLLLANLLLIVGQVAVSIVDALQKIYISNVIQFVYNLIYWVGLIVVVLAGGSLAEVGIPLLISALVWFILIFWKARSFWGSFKLTQPIRPHLKRMIVKQFSYGAKIFTAGFCGFFLEPLSKILVSKFVGIDLVAFYDIALRIKHQVAGLFQKAAYPLFPYISEQPKSSQLNDKITDMSKKIQLSVVSLSMFMLFTFPILVKLWLGEDYTTITLIYILAITISYILFSPPILPIYYYLQSKNMADRNIYMHLGAVIVNIVVFFVVYKYIGVYAILISNTISIFFTYLLGIYYMKKYNDLKVLSLLKYYITILLWVVISGGICYVLKCYIVPETIFDVLLYPLVIILILVIFTKIGYLINKSDIDRYLGTMPKVKNMAIKLLIK